MKRNPNKNSPLTQFVLKTVNELEGPTTAAIIIRTVMGVFPNINQNSVRAILTTMANSGKIYKEILPNTNNARVQRVLYGPLHYETAKKPFLTGLSTQAPVIGISGSDVLQALSALYPEKTRLQIIDAALLRFYEETISGKVTSEAEVKKDQVKPSHDVSVTHDQSEIHIHVHLNGLK